MGEQDIWRGYIKEEGLIISFKINETVNDNI